MLSEDLGLPLNPVEGVEVKEGFNSGGSLPMSSANSKKAWQLRMKKPDALATLETIAVAEKAADDVRFQPESEDEDETEKVDSEAPQTSSSNGPPQGQNNVMDVLLKNTIITRFFADLTEDSDPEVRAAERVVASYLSGSSLSQYSPISEDVVKSIAMDNASDSLHCARGQSQAFHVESSHQDIWSQSEQFPDKQVTSTVGETSHVSISESQYMEDRVGAER
eukprot:gene35951-44332_t